MKKNKNARPSKGTQINALIQEYQENESVIKSLYQSYTGSKAGLSDTQIVEVGRLYRYYEDKVFLSIEDYKSLKIRSSFAFLSYVCGVVLPKGIDYSSTEAFCKVNAESYYNEIKARQMRLIRLAELAGHKVKKTSNSKEDLTALERVEKQVLGSKSKWTDQDRKSLLNALMAYFARITKSDKGKVVKKVVKVEGQKAA